MAAGLCDEEIFRLIRLIYEAAEDVTLWPVLLRRMTEIFHAPVGTLDFYDLAERSGDVAASVNISPEFIRAYAEYYSTKNLWINHRPEIVQTGKAVTGQMLVPDDVLFRSEFYQDFLRHSDIFHLAGGRILERETLTANVSFLRPRSAAAFGPVELAFFDHLLPHLQQALALHQKISAAAGLESASAEALDRIPLGVLVVDSAGRVLSANQRATEILAAHDGLAIGPEGLRAAAPAQSAHLRKLIAGAAATCRGCGVHPGGALAIDRPSLKPPLGVRVIPLTRWTRLARQPQAAAIVFVSDPGLGPTVSHLVSLFQLTPAEERLAIKLVEGQTLEQAAEALHVSRNTAATQLKSIFQKTGTRRQAELVRLLLGSVAALTP